MDFFDVYEKAAAAIARARAGEGPTLLECKTYRFMGHYVGDNLAYRTKEEAESWKQKRDPLEIFETHVVEGGLVDADTLRAVDGDVVRLLDESVAFAESSPFPTLDQVTTDVYVMER
jgi:TPP-dependent pyruvate/acetoin dehydrogenase alpha subunit